jgi:glycosyltransferase involved in cell wall biosynthesis
VARLAAREGAAVVHAHDAHGHAAAVLAASAFGLDAPVIVHRRVDFPPGGTAFSRWKYRHRSVRRIVCVSQAIAGILRRDVRDGGRIEVVPDAVDVSRFARARPDGRLRRELGIPATVPLVGNVAALAAHKDHATFVDAAALLLDGGLDARFVVVGDGPLRREIAARARDRGIASRLLLAGFRDDVPALLPELDVFLFTSREEGLGSSILEAFASRVPVVATAAGGIPELVSDGATGLLAPAGDAAALAWCVRRVLGDPALRARLVEGGARRAAEHGVERMGERVLAIYREVAAGPAATATPGR